MRLPNAVIAGAPKCGTSSLFRWLDDHPEVCGSYPKETFFLLDRGHPLFDPARNVHDHGMERYGDYFTRCEAGNAHVFLEATTHYLYQRTAPEMLSRLTPVPNILFLLRKPSERVYSSYQYTRNNLAVLKAGVSFADFIGIANGAPAHEYTDPRWRGNVEIWRNDVAYSQYVEYLFFWATHFPRERIHVFLLEDMKKDPRAFMQRVSRVLEIDPSIYDTYSFSKRNESYTIKSQRLQRLAMSIGQVMPRGRIRTLLRGGYLRGLTRNPATERTPGDLRAIRELDEAFAPYNDRLARDFGLDLSAWL